jgi:hypothetical protein
MRRTLAIALAVGLLFVGGCDRARSAAPPAAPAPASSPAAPGANPAANAGANSGTTQKAGATDVDGLLDQVDQQLSNDAQPAEDED